jgi:hypothetical protein
VKLHTYPKTDAVEEYLERKWEEENDSVHPQKTMMREVASQPGGRYSVSTPAGTCSPPTSAR